MNSLLISLYIRKYWALISRLECNIFKNNKYERKILQWIIVTNYRHLLEEWLGKALDFSTYRRHDPLFHEPPMYHRYVHCEQQTQVYLRMTRQTRRLHSSPPTQPSGSQFSLRIISGANIIQNKHWCFNTFWIKVFNVSFFVTANIRCQCFNIFMKD